MIKVGIDTIALYTSHYALSLETLAAARGIDPKKYNEALGQYTMSVAPPGEDIVTLSANAAAKALEHVDRNEIAMVLLATESGIDQSKSAGIYVHRLLGLPSECRIVELKQACYSGTAALQLSLPFLRQHPDKKVLVIAADIARYGLNTTGESSQGAGAVAMVLSANPRMLAIEQEYSVHADDVMDFWRPNYLHEALVEGKYSSKLYLNMLEKCWVEYQRQSGRGYLDHAYYCYHTPVPRLVEKAHQHLLKASDYAHLPTDAIEQQIQPTLTYSRQMGNSYTAGLYVGLISLFDHAQEDLTAKRIGLYSYGSGCVAEYFSGVVQPGYKAMLNTAFHQQLLASRSMLTYAEYEAFYGFNYVEDGSAQDIPVYETGMFGLTKLDGHKRIYTTLQQDANYSLASNA